MVLNILVTEGITALYDKETGIISWVDESNDEHYIYEMDIDYSNGKVAWFQSSYWNKHLLRVFENGNSFDWDPITHNHAFGCDCHLVEWYGDFLIFIYQEKHDVYICIIRNKLVKYFNFYGDQISRYNDIFLFKTYRSNEINRIKVPELVELESITKEDAARDGLVPMTIGYPNDLKVNIK